MFDMQITLRYLLAMDVKQAIEKADGQSTVARACVARGFENVNRFVVHQWSKANKLPTSEWTGETQYAEVICDLLAVFGHNVKPIDLCPGAGQYMIDEREAA